MNNKYLGRAGEKLEFALHEFKIDCHGKTCADFGSAVGGFVDCLLKHGAVKVYAIETGYGVLDWQLRNNPRVVVMERTNAIHVDLPEKVDIITIDASWTKQAFLMPNAMRSLKPDGLIVSLIKPHYEVDKPNLHKGKLDEQIAEETVKSVVFKIEQFGFKLINLVQSPIVGGKAGNIEYLGVFTQKL